MTERTANALGVVSLLFWSMNISVTRHIGEAHPFGLPGLSFVAAGLLVILFDRLRGSPTPWRSGASRLFWLLGGGSFVLYLLLYTSGLTFSPSRAVALPMGLVNYFWPSLILVLMPFFFKARVAWGTLAAGLLLCVAGVGCALLWGMGLNEIALAVGRNLPAFAMMAAAAFLWAFYSNAARKWGGDANGVGWFQLAGGICFLLLWLVEGGPLGFEKSMLVPFVLHAVLVNAVAYMLWDTAVRQGDIGLMGTLANFLPVASVAFGSWYLGDKTTPGLWLGGALVTAGAILCRRGIR